MWACIFGYAAIAVSFYLYITRTAQIEPESDVESLGSTTGLGGRPSVNTGITRKAA